MLHSFQEFLEVGLVDEGGKALLVADGAGRRLPEIDFIAAADILRNQFLGEIFAQFSLVVKNNQSILVEISDGFDQGHQRSKKRWHIQNYHSMKLSVVVSVHDAGNVPHSLRVDVSPAGFLQVENDLEAAAALVQQRLVQVANRLFRQHLDFRAYY